VCEVFESLQSADGEWSYASLTSGPRSWGETEFSGNMRLTNLFFSSNPNQYQDAAFTSLEKTKLSWLNIDADELFINQIKYLDNSIQTTAFTDDKDTMLNNISGRIRNIQYIDDELQQIIFVFGRVI
jgi:hypothetical protein